MIPAFFTYQVMKRHMLAISIVLHILLLLWLLGFLHTRNKKNIATPVTPLKTQDDDTWASTRARHSAPVVFMNMPSPTQPPAPAQAQAQQPSTSSAPQATQLTIDTQQNQPQDTTAQEVQNDLEPTDASVSDAPQPPTPTDDKHVIKQQPNADVKPAEQSPPIPKPSAFFAEAARKALYRQMPIAQTPATTRAATQQQPKMQPSILSNQTPQPIGPQASRAVGSMPSMAHIAQGFSQYVREEGEHTINVMGDPRKLPTEQQLKQHHYIEKLLQCLHASYATLKTFDPAMMRIPTQDPVITMVAHRNGSVSDIRIVRSSESSTIDDFYIRLFKDAGNSFPPLPSYFPYDSYRINWLILAK